MIARAARPTTGRACLDLVATRRPVAASPRADAQEDLLDDVDALRDWLADLGRTVGRLTPDASALGHVLCLRHAMTLVLDHVLDGAEAGTGTRAALPDPPPSPVGVRDRNTQLRRAVDTVNERAASSTPTPVLRAVGADDELVVRAPRPADITALLAMLARDLLDLLADDDARGRLRRCAAADCRRIFLGDRLGRPRRWCSSAGCGARTRVAAYRARRARD